MENSPVLMPKPDLPPEIQTSICAFFLAARHDKLLTPPTQHIQESAHRFDSQWYLLPPSVQGRKEQAFFLSPLFLIPPIFQPTIPWTLLSKCFQNHSLSCDLDAPRTLYLVAKWEHSLLQPNEPRHTYLKSPLRLQPELPSTFADIFVPYPCSPKHPHSCCSSIRRPQNKCHLRNKLLVKMGWAALLRLHTQFPFHCCVVPTHPSTP